MWNTFFCFFFNYTELISKELLKIIFSLIWKYFKTLVSQWLSTNCIALSENKNCDSTAFETADGGVPYMWTVVTQKGVFEAGCNIWPVLTSLNLYPLMVLNCENNLVAIISFEEELRKMTTKTLFSICIETTIIRNIIHAVSYRI